MYTVVSKRHVCEKKKLYEFVVGFTGDRFKFKIFLSGCESAGCA